VLVLIIIDKLRTINVWRVWEYVRSAELKETACDWRGSARGWTSFWGLRATRTEAEADLMIVSKPII